MSSSRVARGRRTQSLVAEWFQRRGWASAQSTPAFLPGKDVTGIDGYSIEVKATSSNSILAAIKQAQANAADGDIPIVIWRPNGYGETRQGEWIACTTLEYLTRIMEDNK